MSAAAIETEVLVIGAGPAGLVAALRAGDLGARTTLLARDVVGGMAANDGPVPVRTLAHAARLMRDARQLGRYGVTVSEPVLDYPRLLARVREVVEEVRARGVFQAQIDAAGVAVCERTGVAGFIDPHTVETESGLRLRAEKIILCTGGTSRRLSVPGGELTGTHSDVWRLTEVPPTMLVIGGGATGAQVASIFNGFGTRVELFEMGPRILPTEDTDVSALVATRFRELGIVVHEAFGSIESFARTAGGVRMVFAKDGAQHSAEAALIVVAIGSTANTAGLRLGSAGIETDGRGFIRVDDQLRTSAPHVFAAGDATGRLMLVPQALQDGYLAASQAVQGSTPVMSAAVCPIGSFTDPEYAQAGLTEAAAGASHQVVVGVVSFNSTVRTIIDGRESGFCKLIADGATGRLLGCHVVGERAVEIVQAAAIAIAAGMRAIDLALIPLSFPTYTGILGRAASVVARQVANPSRSGV